MEIVPGFHQIDTRGGKSYLSLEPEPLLIDTGMPGQAEMLIDYFEAQGLGDQELEKIVLTHHDLDHIGNARELHDRLGATIYAHRLDAACIAGEEPRRPWVKRISAWIMGSPTLEVNVELEGGEMIAGWQVIHTPGHSAGSISLYKPPILVVGDLLRTGDRCHEMPGIIMEDAKQARESMRKLAELDIKVLAASHGPTIHHGQQKLQALISSW